MFSRQTAIAAQKTLEDPLAHLPCSTIVKHEKGQLIYRQNEPSTSIYLVLDGKVKVTRLAEDGSETMVDIYQTDDFFGESGLIGLARRPEQATALEDTSLMEWTAAEILSITQVRPGLALGLLQIVVQRLVECGHRIESFSVDDIGRRLARTLIRLSQRLGAAEPDGSYRMGPFTHELLAQYVGTSREVVTSYMNQFRRQGYLRYSRKEIVVFRASFDEWLRDTTRQPVKARRSPRRTGQIPLRAAAAIGFAGTQGDHIRSHDGQMA